MRRRFGWASVLVVIVTAVCAVLAPSSFRSSSSGSGASAARRQSQSTYGSAAASGASLEVVALGDSVPAGSVCDCYSFPRLYGRALASRLRRTVHVDNDAVGGWTSSDVLSSLSSDTSTRAKDVADAGVVVIEIGANDTSDQHDAVTSGHCDGTAGAGDCVADELATLKTNLAAIAGRIATLRQGRPTTVVWVGYWNVFEDGDVAYDEYPDKGLTATRVLTRRVNGVIWSEAHATSQTYVDLVAPFRHHGRAYLTSLLASDGDHPSARGHRLIARIVLGDTLHTVRAVLAG